jgi:hypothetical protein
LKYNISKKEAIDALETFGLIKKRTGATTAKYTIRLMDDIAEITKVAEVKETPEVKPENDYTFNA